jgi:hypothetical protein
MLWWKAPTNRITNRNVQHGRPRETGTPVLSLESAIYCHSQKQEPLLLVLIVRSRSMGGGSARDY